MTPPTDAITPFRRALRNVGWLLTGKGLAAVLSIVYLALATRSLGVQQFGLFTLILSTAQAVSTLVASDTWQIVVRFGMPHREAGRQDSLGRLICFCLALDVGGALIGIGIAGVALWLMQGHFGWSATLVREAFAFSVVLLLSVRSTAVGVLRLHDRFALGAGADSVTSIVRFTGAVIAVWQQATLTGFLLAWAAAEVLTALGYWIAALRVAPGTMRGWRGAMAASRENAGIWQFTFVTNLNATLNAASRQFVVVLVGLLTGAAAAGNYRLAYQLSQSLVRLADMFARGVFPEVTRAHAAARMGELRTLMRQSARLAVGVGLATCLLVPLLGWPALHLIAGEAYLGAYPILILLGLAAGLDIMAVGFEPVLLGTGHATRALRIRVAAVVVLFGGVVLLMPSFGVMGAGAASLIASAVALIALVRSAYVVTRLGERG
ncbi:lipopolysaccharide biosynthesis protein [Sphingomonas jeddahensis]|uniref:Inner membrane protein YghQ n=1 Tax=Sphingomonas jeddahensis TaxID=1915074 RepID=A0A1V2EY31_9SPHN|nr:oligosaccharide flippase family protein [Sphingomonas jeddahensis]ONF97099.1 Inner membrane protein YghQ [Sphingomonas jeddahensis]